MKQRVVFVDVDDTLIRSFGSKRIPMPPVVARVRELHEQGVLLYLWSSGGAKYAHSSTAELGIEHCFAGFLPKPDVYLDDQSVDEWRYCRHVLPGNASDAQQFIQAEHASFRQTWQKKLAIFASTTRVGLIQALAVTFRDLRR